MKKPLHNLFGIVFVLICFCFLAGTTIWQYLSGNQIENLSPKFERFFDEMFTFEYFFVGLITLLMVGLISFFFCGLILMIYQFLVNWPHDFKTLLTFKHLINIYTIIGFLMIYTWLIVFTINS